MGNRAQRCERHKLARFWWEGGVRSYVQISCPVAILDRMFLREFLKDGRVLRPSLRKLA